MAETADRLGFAEVWLGEGPTWDSFALATAVGLRTERIALTAGPVPVSVRDPASIARGAAGVSVLTGREVGVALGTSSTRVVEGFHGRSRARPVSDLLESARALRHDFTERNGDRPRVGRLPAAQGPLTIAAFGDRAIRIAAEYGDRMLLDLVTPEQVAVLREKLDSAAARIGRPAPPLAAWLPVAVDPEPGAYRQVAASVVGYLPVKGYREVFIDAGFAEVVELADAGADRERLLEAMPDEAARTVGILGDRTAVAARLEEYETAGLDEVAVLPVTTGDPAGERTLKTLAALRLP